MNLEFDRASVTSVNSDGTIESVNYGKTQAELKADHENGKCDFSCGYCYADACDYMTAANSIRSTECPDCKFKFNFKPHDTGYTNHTLVRIAGTEINMVYLDDMNREYIVCPNCKSMEHQFSAEARELDYNETSWYSGKSKQYETKG